MTVHTIPTDSGEPGAYDDATGLVTVDGEAPRPLTAAERSMFDATLAHRAALLSLEAGRAAVDASRDALTAVLALAASYPYPDPAETGIVDAQAAAALEQFRALTDPPADVVALAAAVVSWRATA